MSIISRTLVINPVEPAPISLKLRTGLDTKVALQFLMQDGAPYNTDFAAQFYLVERSSGRVRTYLLPATDVVNGKAQAFIPAGDIKDPNGYNVQVLGTVNGEPTLIAKGSASVYETEALGIVPVDLIDDIDLTFSYNEPASFDIVLWKDTGKTVPYDLEAATVLANTYTTRGGVILYPFTVTPIGENKVRISLTEAEVNSLPSSCWWSMSVTTSAGLTTMAQGDVLILGVPEAPFASLTATYTYDKPAVLTMPGSGFVQQGSGALDLLRVSPFDKAGTDQTALLARLIDGDTISVGATIWTINSIDVVGTVFQFVVSPAAADDATGDLAFTFKKS